MVNPQRDEAVMSPAMAMAVVERTREIGIRMAIGAKPRQILLQFLIEASILSFAGGVAGTKLGAGVYGVSTDEPPALAALPITLHHGDVADDLRGHIARKSDSV